MLKTLTFKTLDGRTYTGAVKNGAAKLGSVASRLATRAGLSGTFELVDKEGVSLDPNTSLEDLPDGEEIAIASELTPA
jgi:hypothetical protein